MNTIKTNMKHQEDDFRFFVDLNIDIQKAKKENGDEEEVMYLEGIASTKDKDADGHILDPNGFILDYFLKSGFINWGHASLKDPSSIIGEPVKAYVKDDKFYIKAKLYNWSELGKKVYELCKGLQNDSNRRLGWSIEGRKISVNPLNKNYISKAKIVGCAITPLPKNPATIVDVVKGEKNGFEDLIFEEEQLKTDKSSLPTEYILNIIKPNGDKIIVDKNFNLSIYKSMDTSSNQGIIREDVEGNVINLEMESHLKRLCKAYYDGEINFQKFSVIKSLWF